MTSHQVAVAAIAVVLTNITFGALMALNFATREEDAADPRVEHWANGWGFVLDGQGAGVHETVTVRWDSGAPDSTVFMSDCVAMSLTPDPR